MLISACPTKACYVPKNCPRKADNKRGNWLEKANEGWWSRRSADELYHWDHRTAQREVNNAKKL